MTFAERLRATRELGEIPAYKLAELAELSGGYPAHLESGRRENPGMDAIGKIARVLGVSIDYLVSGTEPAPTKEQVMAAVAAARAAFEAKEPAA
jgi:transcriptional regulator with XRE-family HTH domain